MYLLIFSRNCFSRLTEGFLFIALISFLLTTQPVLLMFFFIKLNFLIKMPPCPDASDV